MNYYRFTCVTQNIAVEWRQQNGVRRMVSEERHQQNSVSKMLSCADCFVHAEVKKETNSVSVEHHQ